VKEKDDNGELNLSEDSDYLEDILPQCVEEKQMVKIEKDNIKKKNEVFHLQFHKSNRTQQP
jgi:hypothetical protein